MAHLIGTKRRARQAVAMFSVGAALSASSSVANPVEYALVEEEAELIYKVPTDDSEAVIWRNLFFDDSEWTRGTLGIGFDSSGVDGNYYPFLYTELHAEMRFKTASNFIRIPFVAPDVEFSSLVLRVRYDDGFVAFLNGVEIARANAPDELHSQSSATRPHQDVEAVHFVDFDISAAIGTLNLNDDNILAIHGMNAAVGSADYLIDARLVALGPAAPVPTSIEPITSVEFSSQNRIRFTLPAEFDCVPVTLQYSPDMSDGSWLDLGRFVTHGSVPEFTDPDPARTAQGAGFYRAVLINEQ
jgi:hypothetical protein